MNRDYLCASMRKREDVEVDIAPVAELTAKS
jgi:hypothetical protein